MASIKNNLAHLRFIQRKPLVMLRIINGFFRTIILRKNTLRSVDWAMTYRCNFNCQYCSAKDLQEHTVKTAELSVDEIKKIGREASALGAIHFNLTGGEPTLRGIETLCAIIRSLRPKQHLISMVTNASLLKKEDIKKLKDAGLDTIQLSIESVDPQVHDTIRRTVDNHNKILEVMQWAKAQKLNICLSGVLTRHNFHDMQKLIDFARKEKVFFLINLASSSGNWKSNDDVKLTTADLKAYYALFKEGHVRTDTILNFRGRSGCPAGVERIYISANGEVMTCPHVQVSYGNVRTEPLAKIYYRISHFPVLKKFEKHCRHVFNKAYIQDYVYPQKHASRLPVSIFDLKTVKEHKELQEFLDSTK